MQSNIIKEIKECYYIKDNGDYIELYIYVNDFKNISNILNNSDGYISLHFSHSKFKHKIPSLKFLKKYINSNIKNIKYSGIEDNLIIRVNNRVSIKYTVSRCAKEEFKLWFNRCREHYDNFTKFDN